MTTYRYMVTLHGVTEDEADTIAADIQAVAERDASTTVEYYNHEDDDEEVESFQEGDKVYLDRDGYGTLYGTIVRVIEPGELYDVDVSNDVFGYAEHSELSPR